jgi:hypothetical protein
MQDVPSSDRPRFTREFVPDELDLDRLAAALHLLLKTRGTRRISGDSDLPFGPAEVTHVLRANRPN